MAGKPVLHYFDGRGRMEPIRWLLAAAGVEVRSDMSAWNYLYQTLSSHELTKHLTEDKNYQLLSDPQIYPNRLILIFVIDH